MPYLSLQFILPLAYVYSPVTPLSVESMATWCGSNFEGSLDEELDTSSSSDTTSLYNWGLAPTTTARRSTKSPNRPQRLSSPDEVVTKYIKLKNPSTMPKLSVKLARESFFGDETLIRCTVSGQREHASLPEIQLHNLKLFMVRLFPLLIRAEFEEKWKDCLIAIGQACKRLRKKHSI